MNKYCLSVIDIHISYTEEANWLSKDSDCRTKKMKRFRKKVLKKFKDMYGSDFKKIDKNMFGGALVIDGSEMLLKVNELDDGLLGTAFVGIADEDDIASLYEKANDLNQKTCETKFVVYGDMLVVEFFVSMEKEISIKDSAKIFMRKWMDVLSIVSNIQTTADDECGT